MSTTESADGLERVPLAAQLYIYGYPLVYNFTRSMGLRPTPRRSRSALRTTSSATRASCSGRRLSSSRPTTTRCTSRRRVMCAGDRSSGTCRTRAAATPRFSSWTRGRRVRTDGGTPLVHGQLR